MPELAHKIQLTLTVFDMPLKTPTTDLGLSIRVSMFKSRETGDWDIFRAGPIRKNRERICVWGKSVLILDGCE